MSEEGRWDLPQTWQWAEAREFSTVIGGGTPKNAKSPDNYTVKGIAWITPADLSGYKGTHISRGARDLSSKGFNSCSARLIPEGTVLLSSRAPVGYCVVASNPISTNQGFKSFVLHGNELAPEYLRYYLIGSKQYLESQASGTTFLELSGGRAEQLLFPIAPAREQQRIVSKIDELFSRIDEGERALERVEKLVERYRQSVLKAAVTGELTRDWREKQAKSGAAIETGEALLARILIARRDAWERAELGRMKAKGIKPKDDKWKQKYTEPSPPDTSELPDLPEGWVWASVDQVGLVSGGLTKNQKRKDIEIQCPYLRVANVYTNRLDLSDVHMIGVAEGELDRVLLKKDDVLVVEGNGSIDQIGRVAIWDGSIDGCVHQNHLIKIRCSEVLPSWYVLVWCMSPAGRDYIRRVASSTAGLHTLSISKIQALPVPVPVAGELSIIRDQFEQMDSLVANQRASFKREALKSAALRQSVLKKAFSGNLLPQFPRDEPATVLLDRIASDRANAPAKPKRGPKNKKNASK